MVLSRVRRTIRRGQEPDSIVDAVIPPRQSNEARQRDTKAGRLGTKLNSKPDLGILSATPLILQGGDEKLAKLIYGVDFNPARIAWFCRNLYVDALRASRL